MTTPPETLSFFLLSTPQDHSVTLMSYGVKATALVFSTLAFGFLSLGVI